MTFLSVTAVIHSEKIVVFVGMKISANFIFFFYPEFFSDSCWKQNILVSDDKK